MKRLKKALLSSAVGLIVNLGLSAMKFVAGAVTSSIAIQADAVNNLTDAISSLTTLIGFKISGRYADKEHPFGHGRMEYISGFFVSVLIAAVGLEFFKTSVERIINPSPVYFSLFPFIVLIITIIVKLAMGLYYLTVSKRINSLAVRASAFDSFSDSIVTGITVISFLISRYTDMPIDGIGGVIVAAVIIAGAIKLIRELLNPLLGCSPKESTVDCITSLLTSYEHILGIHDLIIHEYGPENFIASVHAEIPQEMSFKEAHQLTETAEKAAMELYGINLVIHGDPVDVKNPELQFVRYELKRILRDIDKALAYHDLRLVPDDGHIDVVFDLVIPYGRGANIEKISEQVSERLKHINPQYDPEITADRR